jgi:hypothetical protein
MDYKNLLLKYINHVGEIEGTTFLGRSLDVSDAFSDEEKKELITLSQINSLEQGEYHV